MKRLVLLLLIGLGWAAYSRLSRHTAGSGASAPYPFPTGQSHAAIPAGADVDLAPWCEELGCSEADLRQAIGTVGRSVEAVRDYLARS